MNGRAVLVMTSALLILGSAASFADDEDYLKPYAQVRTGFGYAGQNAAMSETSTVKGDADTEPFMKNANARIGLKAKKGSLEGVVELGLGKDGLSSSTDVKKSGTTVGSFNMSNTYVTTRHVYGIWNFGEKMSFLFGQTEAPYAYYSSSAADDGNGNKAFGATHQDRDVLAKLTVYGIYASLINTTITPASGGSLPSYTSGTTTTTVAASNISVVIPKCAAGYDFAYKAEGFEVNIGPGAAMQSLKIDKKISTAAANAEVAYNGKTILSYLAYAHASVKAGGFSVLGNIGYGQNTSNMGLRYDSQGFLSAASSLNTKLRDGYIASTASIVNGSVKNSNALEGFIDAGYAFSIVEFHAGCGAASVSSYSSGMKKTRVQSQTFAQASFPIVPKKLYIKPEITYRDYGKYRTNDEGSEWIAGIYFQANLD